MKDNKVSIKKSWLIIITIILILLIGTLIFFLINKQKTDNNTIDTKEDINNKVSIIEELSNKKIGDNIKFGNDDYTVLDIVGDEYLIIANKIIVKQSIDDNYWQDDVLSLFDEETKEIINNHSEGLILLTRDEFIKYKDLIQVIDDSWWLKDISSVTRTDSNGVVHKLRYYVVGSEDPSARGTLEIDDEQIKGEKSFSYLDNELIGIRVALWIKISNKEKQTIDIDIWDIKPRYVFDDIRVKFAFENLCSPSGLYEAYRNLKSAYSGYENGGLLAKVKDELYVLNGEGQITEQFKGYNVVTIYGDSYPSNIWIYDPLTSGMIDGKMTYFLLNDYSAKESGMSTYGYVGPGYYMTLNNNGKLYMVCLDYSIDESGNEQANIFSVDELSLGFFKEKSYKNSYNDYAVFKSSTIDLTDYSKENGYIDGYIITDGNTFKVLENIPSDYHVEAFTNGVIMFSKKEYEDINFASTSTIFDYPVTKKVIYIDVKGNTLASDYDDGYGFYEDYAAICKDDKWGYIDKGGKVVVPLIFDKATPICDGKAWVTYKGKTGRLNITQIINNKLDFIDETLKIDSYDTLPRIEVVADVINVRSNPSTSGTNESPRVKTRGIFTQAMPFST